MDFTSLYYFIEAAKDLHITMTAKRLFMSQQTLSNCIMRLEKHYGVKLFHRRPRLQLTSAGKEMLNFAEQVCLAEKNLKGIFADTVQGDSGEITIGASSPRSNYYLPDVLENFSEKYPNVTVNLIDKTSGELEKLVQKNQVDFAVTVESDINRLGTGVKSTHSDPVYFCVSDRLLYKYYGNKIYGLREKSKSGADMKDFSKLPFLMIYSQNRLGKKISECFQNAGYAPKSYLNAAYTTIMVPLCNAALAGCFTSRMNLSRWKSIMDDDVNIFPLLNDGKPVALTLYVIYNKQRYLNHHCRYFLELLDGQFSAIEVEKLIRASSLEYLKNPSNGKRNKSS